MYSNLSYERGNCYLILPTLGARIQILIIKYSWPSLDIYVSPANSL